MASILDQIVESKWREVFAARARIPDAELEQRIGELPPVRDFAGALDRPGEVRVIAEVKAVMDGIADASGLVLDPDVDTYYAMDVAINRAPDLAETLAQARGLTIA